MTATTASPSPPPPPVRLTSLDAYRGFIMLLMASVGFGIPQVARQRPDTAWESAAWWFQHVTWVGCSTWDLIQPAFMFMVGVALPYSYARRRAAGGSYRGLLAHALIRSAVLVAFGVLLASKSSATTNFLFTNVLAQIGLGYLFVFLLWDRGLIVQKLALAVILGGYWLAFYLYPAPSLDGDFMALAERFQWPADYVPLTGLAAHWNMNTNFATWFDQWFLNRFPRQTPFEFSSGGYQTLNFVPSIGTMILGLMTGEWLRRDDLSRATRWIVLVLTAAGCMGLGLLLHEYACPLVKRIWTPSWVLFSGGAVVGLLVVFHTLIDLTGWRRWAFPLVVVGTNSIVIYLMSQLMSDWTWQTLVRHLGPPASWLWTTMTGQPLAADYLPIVQRSAVLLVFWLVCWWMYRQKLFVRI